MSKLKGRKWEQENKRRRCLRRSLVIVWEGCLQQRQQTWTRDRRCITAARRGRWGPAKVGQGDEEGLASVSRSQRVPHARPCPRPGHSRRGAQPLDARLCVPPGVLERTVRLPGASTSSDMQPQPGQKVRGRELEISPEVWNVLGLLSGGGGLVYDLLVAPATSSASEQTESNDLPSTAGGGT